MRFRLILAIVMFFVAAVPLGAYSVLSHEQVIDLAWEDQIQPMLLQRFPGSPPDALRQAHAFAYGGSLVQDMGYYPFGKKYFSDLLHYVRTGDFVENLLRDASDLNEYAFALGALAHYSSDSVGHPTINRITAIEFPKLRSKFGNEVTYAADPKAHIRTEFGFDMVQVAKNRYTSDRYHDFIGFEISKPLLERAFQDQIHMAPGSLRKPKRTGHGYKETTPVCWMRQQSHGGCERRHGQGDHDSTDWRWCGCRSL